MNLNDIKVEVEPSIASYCILIGNNASSDFDYSLVVGDNCSADSEQDVVVGDTIMGWRIPDTLKSYILQNPNDFKQLINLLVRQQIQ